jgi:CubicO group peptidase (beta-lactamase class C family)
MGLPSVYTTKRQDAPDVLKLDQKALPNEPQIDKLLNRYIHALGGYRKDHQAPRIVPGAAVMVRKNNDFVHLNCYGYANLETGEEVTPATLFDLGSLSKQFTAIGALSLVINKRLDLKARLSYFFPDFPRYADEVTVEELIHHVSAIPEYIDIYGASRDVDKNWYESALTNPDDWYPQMAKRRGADELTNKDVLGWIGSQKLLPRAPNTEFEYSNSGYVVLSEVVAKVAEARFATFIKEQLFDPIEMNSTYVFDETSAFPKDAPEIVNHAICYNRVKDHGFVPVGYTPLNFVYGDGNVHSNIVDLAKWDSHLYRLDYALLCSGEGKEDPANRVRELLWEPIRVKGRKRIDYGAGWNLLRNKFEKTVEVNGKRVTRKYESHGEYHSGEWLGWSCYMARAARWVVPKKGKAIDPDTWDSLGIVVVSNNNKFYPNHVAQKISRLFWGKLKKDNIMNSFD